jgi:hypothetical protein
MVHLQKLQDKYSKDGLLVFAISLHPKAEDARKLAKELGITYSVMQGVGSDLAKQYGFG